MSTHTYTVHMQIGAVDDRDAIRISRLMKGVLEGLVEAGSLSMHLTPSGYVFDSIDVTDADDWAEHVPVEDTCGECGYFSDGSPTNRRRYGGGVRICLKCGSWMDDYEIKDVMV